ncbi:hypothetical protein [Streptomyces luteireticuli]|uniref:hypothetical protein n=1 Tax=Streptomyces luteireticuli TaxID=173858 RepID=UPI0035572DBE
MVKFKKAAAVAACVAVLGTGAGFLSAGTAAADTISCSDTLPAHTNGNAANDVPQQANATGGSLFDLAKCTVNQGNKGLNGADNDEG